MAPKQKLCCHQRTLFLIQIVLCNSRSESNIHLFVEWQYSRLVWDSIASNFGFSTQTRGRIENFMAGFINSCDGAKEGNITLAK